MIGLGGQQCFIENIRDRKLKNCPVTIDDAKNAFRIFGRNLNSIRGITKRKKTEDVPSNQRILLPPDIAKAQKNVTLCIDYMFLDKMTFLVTISRNLHFITIANITTRAMQLHCLPAMKNVTGLYKAPSFTIDAIHVDEEFKSLKQSLLEPDNILVNIAATNEHVPEIERVIRTIKERDCSTVYSLPFKRFPKILKRAMITKETTWLNSFKHTDHLSPILSRTIVTGLQEHFNTYSKVLIGVIGAYCKVHDKPTITNTKKFRTTPAKALNPTGNLQGRFLFLCH